MALDSIVELTVGDVVKATVKQILKDYAIVSFGDIMAYLPSSEYYWGRDNNLKNKLKLGTELNVVVIQITDKGVMVSVDGFLAIKLLCFLSK